MLSNVLPTVLLASPDSILIDELQHILSRLGLQVEIVRDAESTLATISSMQLSAGDSIQASTLGQSQTTALVLLDVRLPGVANGRLLAAMHECGFHKRCAIALIAEQVSDEWIARLREGVIDDIVPLNADGAAWKKHVSMMQRGHALVRELQQLREASVMEVQRDPVTGVFTRDTLVTILFRETDRVQRLQGSISMVVMDVDDFGHWNQQLGREAGDQLLREVARRVGRALRTYDVLGRLGKDEFLIALPGCSVINAVELTERLRMDVFGGSFWVKTARKEIVEVRLSACFGIAASRGRSPVVVIREAEHTLELAKQMGSDSMRSAGDSTAMVESGPRRPTLFTEAEVVAH